MQAIHSFLLGVFEAAAVAALFVAGGLSLAVLQNGGVLPAGADEPARYAPPIVEAQRSLAPRVWLVDGYNVLNVGLLAGRVRVGLARPANWWSAPFRDELIGRAQAFEEPDAEVWVVFDGAHPPDAPAEGRVRSVFAPSADEWLLARIRELAPGEIALVTADRRLAARARRHGVEVVAPAVFLARCRALG